MVRILISDRSHPETPRGDGDGDGANVGDGTFRNTSAGDSTGDAPAGGGTGDAAGGSECPSSRREPVDFLNDIGAVACDPVSHMCPKFLTFRGFSYSQAASGQTTRCHWHSIDHKVGKQWK